MDILEFGSDLFAVLFPVANEMGLALCALEHRHDLECRQGAQIRRRENPAVERMREDAAGEIAVEDFPLPGCKHVANTTHPLGVPKNLARHSEFIQVKTWRGRKVNRGHKHDLHVVRLIEVMLDA